MGGKRRVLFFPGINTRVPVFSSARCLTSCLTYFVRLYSSFQERNHKRDISFSEVTTVASFAPGSAVHLNHLTANGNGMTNKSETERERSEHSFLFLPMRQVIRAG